MATSEGPHLLDSVSYRRSTKKLHALCTCGWSSAGFYEASEAAEEWRQHVEGSSGLA